MTKNKLRLYKLQITKINQLAFRARHSEFSVQLIRQLYLPN